MAYGRKYVKKTTTKVYKKKPTGKSKAPSMALQVAKLQRQVGGLVRTAQDRINYTDTNLRIDAYNAGGTDAYMALPLLKYSNWTRIFGTDADDETKKQAVIKNYKCTWRFNTNEPDNRSYAMFVVSLKDEASPLLDTTTGLLGSLTQNQHYVAEQDRTLLNLKYFNVHYYKRWTAGVYPMVKAATGGGATPNQPGLSNIPTTGIDTQRIGSFNLKFGKKGLLCKNPAGDWKACNFPQDPSKNYYVMLFWSGDSAVDLEYGSVKFSPLISVDV